MLGLLQELTKLDSLEGMTASFQVPDVMIAQMAKAIAFADEGALTTYEEDTCLARASSRRGAYSGKQEESHLPKQASATGGERYVRMAKGGPRCLPHRHEADDYSLLRSAM